MRHSGRFARPRTLLTLPISLLVAAVFGAAFLRAEEKPAPLVRSHALPAAPSGPALASAGAPAPGAGDIAGRLLAARSAARSSGQPVPQPAPESAAAPRPAPIAERIGREVTLVRRPGVGTPMQIRGEALQERVESAAKGEGIELTTARAFLRGNRTVLGLDDPDTELAVRQQIADELDFQHIKFEQRWRGLSVWPGELIVHLDRQGRVYLMDGSYVFTPRLPTITPVVGAEQAIARARAETPVAAGARFSAPELIIYALGTRARAPRLAWRVQIDGRPEETVAAIIDASNGALLASIPLVMTENVAGSGRDLFGQTVPLNVWHEATSYLLIDTSKPMFKTGCNVDDLKQNCGAIYVEDANRTPPNSQPDIGQASISQVTSSNPTSWLPADAVSAASNFSIVFDYYRQRHNRNSIDGNGGNILAITRLGVSYQNAFWTDSINGMFFGDAEKYAGSLDVVGHEMTHGVTSKTAGLIYQDQAGALNEALSDIFGEMVENFATGTNDWLVGSRLSSPLRDMANPAHFNDPGTMSKYINTTQDHGGVHSNSGIINHAYYLLAQGLSGAIGRSDAEKIFYRALTTHLTKNGQFLDARLACIQSALELFGVESNQTKRTVQAFDAVEILDATSLPPPPTAPPVSGADSVLFLARNGSSNLVLSRREAARLDPPPGVFLPFSQPAAEEKLAVSGDGTLGFFVTANNDACFFHTDGTGSLACLGLPDTIVSVAMSRDTNVYAFVLLSGGNRENLIRVIDLAQNTTATYTLVAPATDAGSVNTVLFADTLDFTANRRFLVYDAFNVLTRSDGPQIGLWSISVIDFTDAQTYAVIPPIEGLDIGNPAMARTSDNFFTFEADNQSDGTAAIYAANVSTGALSQVVINVSSGPLVPAYTGDDSAIVYSYPDPSAGNLTGRSLAIEALAGDRFTPSGNPQPYLFDGAYPIIYRRGSYTAPAPNCASNATTLCLSAGRFQVTATFTTDQGQQGSAQAVRLTADTGYFTFFDPSNVEVVVKVLNTCGFAQKIWVFAGGLTDVATVITVTDTLTGSTKTYANPQKTKFVPIQDTNAFSTCFAGSIADSLSYESVAGDAGALAREASRQVQNLVAARHADTAGAESTPIAASPTACVQDAQTLCLSANRFRVSTTFTTSSGQQGVAKAVRLTADTGYFTFFDPSNVEVVVKVLNACSFAQKIWVFAGGLTDVQVRMTVTDTNNGTFKTYDNVQKTPFQPIQDTSAFATCP